MVVGDVDRSGILGHFLTLGLGFDLGFLLGFHLVLHQPLQAVLDRLVESAGLLKALQQRFVGGLLRVLGVGVGQGEAGEAHDEHADGDERPPSRRTVVSRRFPSGSWGVSGMPLPRSAAALAQWHRHGSARRACGRSWRCDFSA